MKTILIDAVNTFTIPGEGIFKEMYQLLEEYENPKIILTNANDKEIKEFGLDIVPYPLFTMKHKPEKTNSQYFKKLLVEQDLSVENIIYFEHNIEACKSAESLGINSYHYNKDSRDLNSLKYFLDKNL